MIQKSKYFGWVSRFLSGELNKKETEAFHSELNSNRELQQEVNFHREIETAVKEKDIMELREKLQHPGSPPNKSQPCPSATGRRYRFTLREERLPFNAVNRPLALNELIRIEDGLPILHLSQHQLAARENLHELFRQETEEQSEQAPPLNASDEHMLEEIRLAIGEKDIADLRSGLQQIAVGIPAYPFSYEDIDRYCSKEMDAAERQIFQTMLKENESLQQDVNLFLETDPAMAERDIMALRNQLQKIRKANTAQVPDPGKIEAYLEHQLTEEEEEVFEAQMEVQPELHAELLLHQEINQAIRENDVMELRVRLDNIREESRGIRQKERSLFQRLPRKKLAATAVAASLLLLIGISGILRHDMPATPEKLYQNYYTPYPGTGISRSVTESADRAINTGMLRFNEGNYEEALKQFSLVLEQKEKDPVALFYSGMSFQAIGSYEKAIASYCRVGRGNLFTDQAEWYTGLCYLQLEDRGKAYALFSMIASGKGYYHKQAEAILRKMRYKP